MLLDVRSLYESAEVAGAGLLLDLRSLVEAGAGTITGTVSGSGQQAQDTAAGTVTNPAPVEEPPLLPTYPQPPYPHGRSRIRLGRPETPRERREEREPEPITATVSGAARPATADAGASVGFEGSAHSVASSPVAHAHGTLIIAGSARSASAPADASLHAAEAFVGTIRSDGRAPEMRGTAERRFRDDPLELWLLGVDQGDILAALEHDEDLAVLLDALPPPPKPKRRRKTIAERVGRLKRIDDDTLAVLSHVGPGDIAMAERFAFEAAGQLALDLMRARRR